MGFWAVVGAGVLINTVQGMIGGPNRGAMMRQQEASMRAFRETLNQTSGLVTQRAQPQPSSRPTFDFEPPPFPQQSFERLQDLQQGHQAQRLQVTDQLKGQVTRMKEQFFAERHYETTVTPEGKPQLVLGEDGRPQVRPGPEQPLQRQAREEFEAVSRRELAESHTAQRDSFLEQEKGATERFLAGHADNLSNPQVQAELTRMMVSTQKKAFGLQQQHEDERWRIDLPPDEELVASVEESLSGLRRLEQEQVLAEEQSEDYRVLLAHDQEVAALLGEQKQVARQEKMEEVFLKDPRRAFAVTGARDATTDFSEVLPAYLTSSLFEMGIYSVPA